MAMNCMIDQTLNSKKHRLNETLVTIVRIITENMYIYIYIYIYIKCHWSRIILVNM